ncbi:MAG TPA: bifunctional aldolase/short-chain dehydrogenase [Burkholderiales bacterium]|jgi:rhamnose utilization protein RhaD (predicted bifunctional aldolase and dehydrogenase)/NAD(P)-dependent dehydrogenase (short-subunit alcohol dehydrogenase family)|nr:bifunctional aldolase/short-chain dehydrogenase [Burkholderiales bacterium]
MKSLWSDAEAARFSGPLGPRVYTSRLLGRDKSLVLHGGGNTSVKLREVDLFGEQQDVLYVKGSGWDLETIEASGFTPVGLDYVKRLAALPSLSDPQMVGELATHTLRAGAPAPSVETLLHAILPQKYVDHTHADAVLSISNVPEGDQRIREIYGGKVVVVPYIMAGFDLASYCAREFPRQSGPDTIGMVLLSHGVFSFGADARESYERMIQLVAMAEEYLASRKAWRVGAPAAKPGECKREEIAQLRRTVSEAAGFPLIVRISDAPKFAAFARDARIAQHSQRGPATPDHVIRTKPLPMLGRDVAGFAARYREYFERNAAQAKEKKTMLDPAPRMVLDPQFGFAAIGGTAKDAAIVEELYDHTIDVILRAEALGGWRALEEKHLFDIEYWDLEQAKLRKAGTSPPFSGEIALVTGAASGIGKACVESFLQRGAAVIALDLNPVIENQWQRPDVVGLQCDLTIAEEVRDCLDRATRRFGGVDMLVLNAGIFPTSAAIQDIARDAWRSAMTVNVEASLHVLQACHPLLALAPRRGRVVVIGSRNVPAPGPGAAAYSASKAALTQLARVAALEWAKDGIRVNSIHPDAVYDTALWTEELLKQRAAAYSMTVEQYRRKNLLGTEVTSKDVAELAAEMCGALFAKTTAAQIPVDGGNERVV